MSKGTAGCVAAYLHWTRQPGSEADHRAAASVLHWHVEFVLCSAGCQPRNDLRLLERTLGFEPDYLYYGRRRNDHQSPKALMMVQVCVLRTSTRGTAGIRLIFNSIAAHERKACTSRPTSRLAICSYLPTYLPYLHQPRLRCRLRSSFPPQTGPDVKEARRHGGRDTGGCYFH